jgi:hypothetical protein
MHLDVSNTLIKVRLHWNDLVDHFPLHPVSQELELLFQVEIQKLLEIGVLEREA